MKKGFDNNKYVELQSEKILERIKLFGGKLYLEFGGKLFDDHHAARVLPGFLPDSKLKMLLRLKNEAEVVIVISADAIEKNKKRGDLGITYDLDTLRLIDAFRDLEEVFAAAEKVLLKINKEELEKLSGEKGIEKGLQKLFSTFSSI
jgi:uncharacterized protein (UPF0371 family)